MVDLNPKSNGSNVGKKIGSIFSSLGSSMGNSLKRSFVNGVGFGSGFAIGKGGVHLISKLFPHDTFAWFLLSSLLLQLNDWLLFHFNFTNHNLYMIHLFFALFWAFMITGADKNSQIPYIYRLIINLMIFWLVLLFEFNGITLVNRILSNYNIPAWNRVLIPLWLIIAFVYSMVPEQKTSYVNVMMIFFVIMLFFMFYGQISGMIHINNNPTIAQLQSTNYAYHLFNKTYTGMIKFFKDLKKNFICLTDPTQCVTPQTKNDTAQAYIDTSTYGILFNKDVSGENNFNGIDWDKNISIIGSLSSGSAESQCIDPKADCYKYTSQLFCLIWNMEGDLSKFYDIKKIPSSIVKGKYSSNFQGSTWECSFHPKTKVPKQIIEDPSVNYGAAIMFDYETLASQNLFFIDSVKYSAIMNTPNRISSLFKYGVVNTQNTAGPIIISFGFPRDIKPPIPLVKNKKSNKLFIIKIDYNEHGISEDNVNKGIIYTFTKFYIYLPKGLNLDYSPDKCPFKKVTDTQDAFSLLYGKSPKDLELNDYNVFKLDSSELKELNYDNPTNAIADSYNNQAQYAQDLFKFYCNLKIDSDKVLQGQNHVLLRSYIMTKYKYLRYLVYSLYYNINPTSTTTQSPSPNTKTTTKKPEQTQKSINSNKKPNNFDNSKDKIS